jgi:hypothetical protein
MLTPIQALEILHTCKPKGASMFAHGYAMTVEELTAFANALITKYIGEPVATVELWSEYLGGDKPRELYELKQLPAIHKLPHGTYALYALKEEGKV